VAETLYIDLKATTPSKAVHRLTLLGDAKLIEAMQHEDNAIRAFAQRVFFRRLGLSCLPQFGLDAFFPPEVQRQPRPCRL